MFATFLKIAVKPFRYFLALQANSGTGLEISGGIDGLLIKDLAMALGFDYEIHIPEDNAFGQRTEDGNWTGVIGMLDTGKVDMAATMIGITEDLYKSFTQIPYTVVPFTFVVNKPQFRHGGSRFQNPFQADVWYSCLASYVLTILLLWMFSGRKCSIPILAAKTFGMIFGKHTYMHGTSTATNIVSSCWVISSMFLVFGYSAMLLSSLTLPVREKGIRTIDELVDAVLNRDQKVYLIKGSGALLELLSHNPKFSGVTQKIIDNNWFFQRENDAPPQQLEHKSAYLGARLVLQMDYGIEPFTTKFVSEDSLFVLNIGVAVRKSFCCKKKLRRYINRIMETGLYESYVRQTMMESASDRPLESEASLVTSLSLEHLRGAFLLLLFGLLFSLIVLLIEILYSMKNS